MDANNSGSISINEFRLVFQPQQRQLQKQAQNVAITKEIDEEIKELFD